MARKVATVSPPAILGIRQIRYRSPRIRVIIIMSSSTKTHTKVEACAVNSSLSISPVSTLPTKLVKKSFRDALVASRLLRFLNASVSNIFF